MIQMILTIVKCNVLLLSVPLISYIVVMLMCNLVFCSSLFVLLIMVEYSREKNMYIT